MEKSETICLQEKLLSWGFQIFEFFKKEQFRGEEDFIHPLEAYEALILFNQFQEKSLKKMNEFEEKMYYLASFCIVGILNVDEIHILMVYLSFSKKFKDYKKIKSTVREIIETLDYELYANIREGYPKMQELEIIDLVGNRKEKNEKYLAILKELGIRVY